MILLWLKTVIYDLFLHSVICIRTVNYLVPISQLFHITSNIKNDLYYRMDVSKKQVIKNTSFLWPTIRSILSKPDIGNDHCQYDMFQSLKMLFKCYSWSLLTSGSQPDYQYPFFHSTSFTGNELQYMIHTKI